MKASDIHTGDILWCTYHNCAMEIIDDNDGHPAGDLRPVRARSLKMDDRFVQSIPAVYFEPLGDREI